MLTRAEWFEAICESYSNPPVLVDSEELPAFPSDEMQIDTTGQSGIETLREAYVFYEDCAETFARLGVPLGRDRRLLDFGVGWGRIARFFLRELPRENVYGLDVVAELVEVCRRAFRSDNFFVTTPFPPSVFPDGKFDFVVGYSVFSHLSEEACTLWMREFHRILAPGGLVALTTRGRWFFDYCESLRGSAGYPGELSKMFDDFDLARASYDKGEFVHSNRGHIEGGGAGGAMTADFYGETFMPEQYARTAYSDQFVLEEFLFNRERETHPIMFFRKI